MISWLARQFRNVYRFFTSHDSPRQLAVGVAFGVLLGLLPKGNLLLVALTTLFLTLRVNVSLGMLVAAGVSFVAGLLDPWAHRVGLALLEAPSLRETWTTLTNQPIVPWLQLNNSVVLGSFVIGLVAFYPNYRISLLLFARWQRALEKRKTNRSEQARPASATVGVTGSRIDEKHSTPPARPSSRRGHPSAGAGVLQTARTHQLRRLERELDSLSRTQLPTRPRKRSAA